MNINSKVNGNPPSWILHVCLAMLTAWLQGWQCCPVTWPNTFVHKFTEDDEAWWVGDPPTLPPAPAAVRHLWLETPPGWKLTPGHCTFNLSNTDQIPAERIISLSCALCLVITAKHTKPRWYSCSIVLQLIAMKELCWKWCTVLQRFIQSKWRHMLAKPLVIHLYWWIKSPPKKHDQTEYKLYNCLRYCYFVH